METKYVDAAALAPLKRDREIEGTTGIWLKVTDSEQRLLVLAGTDANPAFVDLWPKMQAELRRLEGVGTDKEEIRRVRCRYYARMFMRDWKNVPAPGGGDAAFSIDAAAEYLFHADDALDDIANNVFETRKFRLARAKETTEDIKN
jgi:hypothetical protein